MKQHNKKIVLFATDFRCHLCVTLKKAILLFSANLNVFILLPLIVHVEFDMVHFLQQLMDWD